MEITMDSNQEKRMVCESAKWLRIMLFLMMLLPFSLSSNAQNQSQTISLNLQKVTLKEFFKQVESKTKFTVIYRDVLVDETRDVSIKATNKPLDEVLKTVLSKKNLQASYVASTIVITPKETKSKDVDDKKSKTLKIAGIVLDTNGDPIIGAIVAVKNSTTATITDFEGVFSLSVASNAVLTVTYLGYQTQEETVNGKTNLEFILKEDDQLLDELVVVGYGVKKKRDVIGSVATVKSEDLNKSGSINVYNNLQGKASGLNITTSAAGNKVMVRGVHSIHSSNDPLWVVDGITTGPPNSEDIESIEILKDASATAIYGSRGSNGVIIVTTKKGKEGKTGLSLNVHSGVNLIQRTQSSLNYANNRQWFDIMDIATENSGVGAFDPMNILSEDVRFKTSDISADEARLVQDNWFDAVTRPGHYVHASLSLSTGSKNGTTYMNANIRKTKENILGNDNNEMNFRINSDYKLTDLLTVGGKLHFNRTHQDGEGNSTIRRVPWQPLYDSLDPERTGYWNPHANPLTTIDTKYKQVKNRNIRILGGVYAELGIPFVKGLALRAEYSNNTYMNTLTNWQSALVNPVTASEAGSRATEQSILGQKHNANAYFKYNNTFGQHTVTGVVGTESERSDGYLRLSSGKNLTTEYPQLGTTPAELTQAQGYLQFENYLLSFFGRADYKFADKYLAGVSFRRDGSSIFDPEYRWGTFTAYSLGWIASEEQFMKNYDWVSLMKLRGSLGQTGNNNIPQNKNLTTFIMDVDYGYGDENVIAGGKKPATIGNSSLTWETTSSYDIGLDYGLFKNRISGSIAYYYQDVKGLILAASVPKSTGLAGSQEVWGNMGKIHNSGFEFNISSINVNNKNFTWTTDFNISTSKNKVVELNQELDSKGIPIYHDENKVVGLVSKTGGMVREFYMPEYAGIDAERGVEMIYELDRAVFEETGKTVRTGRLIPATQGNMQTNRFVLDKKTINPTFYGGLSNTITFKNFDFNLLVTFSGGNYIYDNEMTIMATPGRGSNILSSDLLNKSWTQPGDNAEYPRLVYNYTHPYDWDAEALNPSSPTGKGDWIDSDGNYSIHYGGHSKYLYKGDYLKIKHIEFGYTIPKAKLKALGIENFRVYIAADNIYTTTKYPGWDPQSGFLRGGVVGLSSYTMNPFLVTGTYLAGLQLNF